MKSRAENEFMRIDRSYIMQTVKENRKMRKMVPFLGIYIIHLNQIKVKKYKLFMFGHYNICNKILST